MHFSCTVYLSKALLFMYSKWMQASFPYKMKLCCNYNICLLVAAILSTLQYVTKIMKNFPRWEITLASAVPGGISFTRTDTGRYQ